MNKFFALLVIIAQISVSAFAKNETEEIAVGTGETQLDAIVNSIDNVLSQKYATWTAAMTQMVNDEIAGERNTTTTDPNANVTKYEIFSLESPDGNWVGMYMID